ncbi:hypothetical protein BDV10DRAFT_157157 [Aspergillus recurvatus]
MPPAESNHYFSVRKPRNLSQYTRNVLCAGNGMPLDRGRGIVRWFFLFVYCCGTVLLVPPSVFRGLFSPRDSCICISNLLLAFRIFFTSCGFVSILVCLIDLCFR